MVNVVDLGKKLNSGQSWLISMGWESQIWKKGKFHNPEAIFILALYHHSICFMMDQKYEARIAPAPALVPEWRWHSACFTLVQSYQGLRFLGPQVENNLSFNV